VCQHETVTTTTTKEVSSSSSMAAAPAAGSGGVGSATAEPSSSQQQQVTVVKTIIKTVTSTPSSPPAVRIYHLQSASKKSPIVLQVYLRLLWTSLKKFHRQKAYLISRKMRVIFATCLQNVITLPCNGKE